LKKEGVEQQHFLYIGDDVRDVEAATQAGVDVGAVGWGFHTQKQLSGESPTYLWSCVNDVLTAQVSPGDVLPQQYGAGVKVGGSAMTAGERMPLKPNTLRKSGDWLANQRIDVLSQPLSPLLMNFLNPQRHLWER
jgi:hypothetical protein